MRRLNLLFAMFLLISIASCALNNISTANVNRTADTSVSIESTEKSPDYTDLLKTVYEKFVFAIDADPNVYAHPENYFTSNALKKLQNDYEFDCDGGDCYAFYALRTEEQDSKPGTDGESEILSIEPDTDGWYVVKYLDMGWRGMTRVKIVNDKIDDYKRNVSE